VPPAQRTITPDAIAAAQRYADSQGSSALLIWRAGRLEHAGYAAPTGPGTISHTYTMQYTPLVLLVGMAIADGRIPSLDTPAAQFLPEWRGDARAKITIRNLLQQNAGLEIRRDAHYSEGLYSRDARAYWGSRTKDVIVNEYPALYEPGTRFDYNYIVPEILSVILERATGMPYQDYLSRRLWKPLGNQRAFLWLNRPGGEAHVDAGLFSAPTDWLNLGVLILQNGRWQGRQLVPASFIAEMRRPSATNPNFGFMYLGSPFAPERRMATDPRVTYTVKSAEPFAAEDVAYIDGYGGQRVYIVPSRKLVVVRLGEVAREWDNSRLVNLVLAGTPR
jgi:CubicO group peptidase (beta-lactamase class C family)